MDYEYGEGAINRLVDEEEEDTAYDVVDLWKTNNFEYSLCLHNF